MPFSKGPFRPRVEPVSLCLQRPVGGPVVVMGAVLSAADGHLGCFQTFCILKTVLNQDGRDTKFTFMLKNNQRTQSRSHL